MLQAQGYTPALIYVQASADIQKYQAVSILPGGTVQPSSPSLGVVIGFALQDTVAGEFLPVQVDGILYGYTTEVLTPGVWYFQGANGSITTDSSSGGHIVGFAITTDTFRILLIGSTSEGGVLPFPTEPPVISGADSLYDVAGPDATGSILDGSGSLTEAVEEGWDDWDSVGADGTLTDLFMGSKVEGDPSEQFNKEEPTDSEAGELSSLFGKDSGNSDLSEEDTSGGELGGLSGMLGGDPDSSIDGGALSSMIPKE